MVLRDELRQRYVNEIAIHCSATKPSANYTAEDCQRDHLARGFSRIGYHWFIERDGRIVRGRAIDEIGAHVKGRNLASVGICLSGGLDERGQPAPEYTPEQWEALELIVRVLRNMYQHAEIKGHRDYEGVRKECPCFDVQSWVRTLGLRP